MPAFHALSSLEAGAIARELVFMGAEFSYAPVSYPDSPKFGLFRVPTNVVPKIDARLKELSITVWRTS